MLFENHLISNKKMDVPMIEWDSRYIDEFIKNERVVYLIDKLFDANRKKTRDFEKLAV